MKLRISEDQKYIVVVAQGPMTLERAVMMTSQGASYMEATGLYSLLSDVRGCPNVMPPQQDYQFAHKETNKAGFPRGSRIAILHSPEDDSHQFAETVAINAGYTAKLFTEEEAAKEWLITWTDERDAAQGM